MVVNARRTSFADSESPNDTRTIMGANTSTKFPRTCSITAANTITNTASRTADDNTSTNDDVR